MKTGYGQFEKVAFQQKMETNDPALPFLSNIRFSLQHFMIHYAIFLNSYLMRDENNKISQKTEAQFNTL